MMNGTYIRDGVEREFNYISDMGATTKIRFVNLVTQLLIGENYYSMLRDMMFDFVLIMTMTDVDTSDITDPDNANGIAMIEELVVSTNIAQMIKDNSREGLIEELNRAVDDNIAYRTGIQKNPVSEALASLVRTLERQVANIDTAKIMNIAEALGNISGEFTPEKVNEAYFNSPVFKEKYQQLVNDRAKRDAVLEHMQNEFSKKKK